MTPLQSPLQSQTHSTITPRTQRPMAMKVCAILLFSQTLFLYSLIHPTPSMGASAGTGTGAATGTREEWHAQGYSKPFQASAMIGMTIMGGTVGFGMQGMFAKQILDKGFFPDISNQVYVEALFGPSIMSLGTGFQIGAHLRWDFHRNEFWTFYGLGGLGWDILPTGLTHAHAIHPRFGAGAFWHLFPQVSLRGEISHEFVGAGVAFMF